MYTASSPDSGPIMTSALSFSISRFVSVTATGTVSFPQPYPTILIGVLPTWMPDIPADGFAWLLVTPWANCAKAVCAPPMSTAEPNAKAPLQSVMIAPLTTLACDDASAPVARTVTAAAETTNRTAAVFQL